MGSHFRMKTAIKIGMVLGIFIITLVEPKDDLENIVKEMMMEMNGRMLLLEAELKMTKEELTATKEELKLTATKEELTATKEELTATKEELTATKKELKLTATKEELTAIKEELTATKEELTATKEELSATRDDLISKDHELERDVSISRNPPFIHSCGYQYSSHITHQTIPYSSLLYSSTNTEGGGLDIATGVFTSPLAGSYTVTWSLMAGDDHGNQENLVVIYLRQNGQNIKESRHVSGYSGPGVVVYEQGGRTLVLHLDMGDTLDLYCDDCGAYIYYTTFCVSLSTFDII